MSKSDWTTRPYLSAAIAGIAVCYVALCGWIIWQLWDGIVLLLPILLIAGSAAFGISFVAFLGICALKRWCGPWLERMGID